MSRLASARPAMRGAMVAFALAAIIGCTWLLLAGARDERSTAFSLEVPSIQPAANLGPGQRACQGPISATAAFAGAELWVDPVPAPGAELEVAVRDAGTGRLLAGGRVSILAPQATSPTVRLRPAVASGSRVSICLTNVGTVPVALLGSTADPLSGAVTLNGRPLVSAMSMVLIRPGSRSLLSLLPTSFRRAALFRPSWVGSWTFWALLVLILAGFPLSAAALWSAVRADRDGTQRDD